MFTYMNNEGKKKTVPIIIKTLSKLNLSTQEKSLKKQRKIERRI